MSLSSAIRRRPVLSAALLVGSASIARADDGFIWWCYDGTCCEMEGGAVTTNCRFDCDPGLSGEVNAITILLGC